MLARVASKIFGTLTGAGLRPLPQMGSSTWLLHLRFFAVLGQFFTIIAASLIVEVALPLGWLFGLLGVTAVTNVFYGWWLRWHGEDSPPVESAHLIAIILMGLDLLTLTAMLHLSGGVENPFAYFFFVNLAVGGVALASGMVWSLTATAIGGYLVLLLFSPPLPFWDEAVRSPSPWLLISRLIAFSTCAIVVTYYVTRTARESQRRHEQLMRLQEDEQTGRRLRSLTTLAAGAAHELATPLSTIDVVVRELGHHLETWQTPDSVVRDLRLIDDELERCRTILGRMRTAAGDSAAEPFHQMTLGDLIDASLEGIRQPHRVEVIDPAYQVETAMLWMPTETVAQAIRNLIHNGLDASDETSPVQLVVAVEENDALLRISDMGEGMTPETLTRIAEPFYTTKPPGRGMGLGLFLTRNVISQLGGTIEFASSPDQGTTVTVRLPLHRCQTATA